MKQHGKVYSSVEPQAIEMTENAVFLASNIESYTKDVDGHTQSGYKYDCTEYSKDEYLIYQNEKITALEQELAAAKILLGVE